MFDEALQAFGGWGGLIVSSLNQLIIEVVTFIPTLLAALIIWLVGRWILDTGLNMISRLDLKWTSLDNHVMDRLIPLLGLFGKFVLILIVLDFLGIGSTIIGSITQGLVFAVAIALGIAFGKALEGDAQSLVKQIKSATMKKGK